jgi:hypothetical protein
MLSYYQQNEGIAQAAAFSQAFQIIAVIVFAGAALALFLPSGRPAPRSPDAVAH